MPAPVASTIFVPYGELVLEDRRALFCWLGALTNQESPGVTAKLLLYDRPPPPPPCTFPDPPEIPPPPTATAEIEVTPAGTTKVYEPGDVYAICPVTALVVMLLLAALAAPVPTELVAVTVNV
jgi:hypothetical protein